VVATWQAQLNTAPKAHQKSTTQAHLATTNLLACWHTGHHLPLEGSNTTRLQLQTYLRDADKQDWMLKEEHQNY
jgi:hypothetical protein